MPILFDRDGDRFVLVAVVPGSVGKVPFDAWLPDAAEAVTIGMVPFDEWPRALTAASSCLC